MKFSHLCVSVFLLGAARAKEGIMAPSCARSLSSDMELPFVSPKVMWDGSVVDPPQGMELADVTGCCAFEHESEDCDSSGIINGSLRQEMIGQIPQMNSEQALQVLETAKQAWNGGSGIWPQLSLKERIEKIELFIEELKTKREEIVVTPMWEIGKNRKDAEAEFDRTIQFVQKVIETIRTDDEFATSWQTIGTTKAFVRRNAIGLFLCLGPYNYPLNETYATLIPALLMGNVVIMKVPTVGGLSHLLTSKCVRIACILVRNKVPKTKTEYYLKALTHFISVIL
jgi:acyl-CoA reductase-like NAD-dependent aldehyde dehydrogenase